MRCLLPLFPFLLALVVSAAGATAQDRPEDGVVVTGRAVVSLVPDRAIVTLSVTSSATTSKIALASFEKKRQKLVEALSRLEGGSIKTSPPRPVLGPLQPDMEQVMMGNAPPENPDMEAREEFEVQVAATGEDKDLATLVSEVVDAGVATECPLATTNPQLQMMLWSGEFEESASAIRYVCDDVAKLEEQAMKRAVDDAASQARSVARIAGVKLGAILGLDAAAARLATEFDSPTPPPQKLQIIVRYGIE